MNKHPKINTSNDVEMVNEGLRNPKSNRNNVIINLAILRNNKSEIKKMKKASNFTNKTLVKFAV